LTKEVVFVFLGEKIPHYVGPSLVLANRYSGLDVRLLASINAEKYSQRAGVKFTALEDFYDPGAFAEASKRVLFSHTAGDGFWLKTLERFFVLGQYLDFSEQESFFHAELDQLLFRADRLVRQIEDSGLSGFFVPFHNESRAVGSITYCNARDKLQSLLDFASTTEPFESEMQLIANWFKCFPKGAHPLPTLYDRLTGKGWADSTDIFGGVADAAQLGQWAGGIDPRNVPLPRQPFNKFVDEPGPMLLSKKQLSGVRFSLRADGTLFVKPSEERGVILYNLHIHSKIHPHLASKEAAVHEFLEAANLKEPVVFPGARRNQIHHRLRKSMRRIAKDPSSIFDRPRKTLRAFVSDPVRLSSALKRRINRAIGRRPSSHPFLSGDTFRAIADHCWEANHRFEAQEVRPGAIIFCESEKADEEFVNVLETLRHPVVLLLGNSDENHAGNAQRLRSKLPAESVLFAQNLVERIDGVSPLPIGLENAWRAKHGTVRPFRLLRRKTQRKIFRVMWTFSEKTNPTTRGIAADWLYRAAVADDLGKISTTEHKKSLSRYAFVASPPGNGLDTHRTWEALYLRCVPIVVRSAMTEAYELLGLPVWVVDSYKEVEKLDEAGLEAMYWSFFPGFAAEELWSPYWINLILSHSALQSNLPGTN